MKKILSYLLIITLLRSSWMKFNTPLNSCPLSEKSRSNKKTFSVYFNRITTMGSLKKCIWKPGRKSVIKPFGSFFINRTKQTKQHGNLARRLASESRCYFYTTFKSTASSFLLCWNSFGEDSFWAQFFEASVCPRFPIFLPSNVCAKRHRLLADISDIGLFGGSIFALLLPRQGKKLITAN